MRYEPIVRWAIKKNWPLIQALRLDRDDVYQDLSIAALKAIDGFDSSKSSSLRTHVASRLQYEVLNLKRRYQVCGLTGTIDDNVSVRSLDYMDNEGFRLEVSDEAPYISEFAGYYGFDEQKIIEDRFYILRPNSNNPYKQLYTPN